jgi:pyruvate ferredoxin oxidoreductase delta subunit
MARKKETAARKTRAQTRKGRKTERVKRAGGAKKVRTSAAGVKTSTRTRKKGKATSAIGAKRPAGRKRAKGRQAGGEKPGWRDIPRGGLIVKAGNAETYETGSWRTKAPAIDFDRCTNCLFCWIWCPDGAIQVKDGKVVGIDLFHCKGCGICAHECPKEAIAMVDERRTTHVA